MPGIFMRFPGGRFRALTLSYDDGVEQDQKLIDIMKRNGLKGTFNLNSGCAAEEGTVYAPGTIHRRMSMRRMAELYAPNGMEVAVHGLTHPFLEQLPEGAMAYELMQDRVNLEAMTGGIVRGMAYPFGTYSDAVVECARVAGIVYARTVISTHSFDMPTDWLRLDPTCHHADLELMPLLDAFLACPGDRAPKLFYLWGHSYEFEAQNNWQVIEAFAERAGGREDIWYATNIEVYDYWLAFSRLLSSADGHVLANPTSLRLWGRTAAGVEFSIEPGETLRI